MSESTTGLRVSGRVRSVSLAGALVLAFGLSGCATPGGLQTPASSSPAGSSSGSPAVAGATASGEASSPARMSTTPRPAGSSVRSVAPAPAPEWPGAAAVTYSPEQIADGVLDRSRRVEPQWPAEITSTEGPSVTFKEWIALHPSDMVFQPSIEWVVDETVTKDRITVHATKGEIYRVLVICQDPAAEITVGTWVGDTFTAAEHQTRCGKPVHLPDVTTTGDLSIGYKAVPGTRARLVVLAEDPSRQEPQSPYADNGSPRFLPAGADPQENLFAELPWRFMRDLPGELFTGRTMQEQLAASPELGVLDPARERIVGEAAGVGVIGPEPDLEGEGAGGMVRLALVCEDPLSGPSSLGYREGATGRYVPLGWSDFCGGYSVTLPRTATAGAWSAVVDVQHWAGYRLVEIAEAGPGQR